MHDIGRKTAGNSEAVLARQGTEQTWFRNSSLLPALFVVGFIDRAKEILEIAWYSVSEGC
jgi:hypothetical protein